MGLKQMIREKIAGAYRRAYCKRRQSFLLDYSAWLFEQRQKSRTGASETKTPDFVMLSFGEGSFAEGARERFARYFSEHPEIVLAYGDEDVQKADGSCCNPWLKPDWSPDSYLCRDYLGEAVAVRRECYDCLNDGQRQDAGSCHDELVELAGGYEPDKCRIGHLQEVLFHRRKAWELPGAGRPGMRRKKDHGNLQDVLVSIIIPSKDNPKVLSRCLDTVVETVRGVSYELLVVDNGSSPENREYIHNKLKKLSHDLTNKEAKYIPALIESLSISTLCI